jgi:very-short-patch-repair endonuclease
VRIEDPGHKFRRQYPIGKYIDFACVERQLVVESMECQHAERPEYDAIQIPIWFLRASLAVLE